MLKNECQTQQIYKYKDKKKGKKQSIKKTRIFSSNWYYIPRINTKLYKHSKVMIDGCWIYTNTGT